MPTGGLATISSGGWLQNATAASALVSATSQMWQKIRFKVDTLKGLSSGTQMALTANGSLTNTSSDTWDIGFVGVTGGKYQMKMTANSNNSLTSSGTDLQSALPANGSYLVAFIFAAVSGNVGCTIFDDSGGSYASVSGSFVGTLNGAGSGFITVNDCNIVGFDANAANVYNGTAFYNSVPPTSGTSRYSPPTIGDSGLIYLSFMNDPVSSTSAAAQVGSVALADNGTVTYSGPNNANGLWGPGAPGVPTRRGRVINFAAIQRASRW
jgi:hypothetical protein